MPASLYDSIAKEWDCTRRNFWGEFEFARGFLNSKKILDAGCGNGRLVRWLRESGFSGEYLGVDNSKELLKLAKKNFPDERFELHNLRELTGSGFDAIFCIAVLHHFRSKEERLRVLKNFHASTQRNGKIFITVWNLFQPRFFRHLFKSRSRDCEIEFAKKGKRFIHAFSKRELKDLLKRAGFQKAEVFYARHSQRTNFFRGRNLIAIAQKGKTNLKIPKKKFSKEKLLARFPKKSRPTDSSNRAPISIFSRFLFLQN
ncbi:class I SAM-dependent methyltransferase [Candidatus Gracilibacteria bacterium]|nr:class I SAM-dependent methyltransferase [Candidatus Gracilibacteria bacterium]